LAKSRRRFGPQGAKTFLATLAEEADLSGALKSDFSREDSQGFADPSSGVVEKKE
jgi:hypothetical protein